MLGFLKFLILAPVAAVLVLLGVANRQMVSINIDPTASGFLPQAVSIPLFVFFFGTLAAGIVIGYIASWFAQGRHRKAERQLRRECDRLTGECDRLKGQMAPTTLATLGRS